MEHTFYSDRPIKIKINHEAITFHFVREGDRGFYDIGTMDCDAFTMWEGIMKGDIPRQKRETVMSIVRNKSWKGVEPYTRYVHYEFIDTDIGEILEMNCRTDMDSLMIDNKFYPPVILNQILSYERD